jgi:hypothetical protein
MVSDEQLMATCDNSADVWLVATSNDPWGPTGTDMAEIAALTFNK